MFCTRVCPCLTFSIIFEVLCRVLRASLCLHVDCRHVFSNRERALHQNLLTCQISFMRKVIWWVLCTSICPCLTFSIICEVIWRVLCTSLCLHFECLRVFSHWESASHHKLLTCQISFICKVIWWVLCTRICPCLTFLIHI